MGNTNRRISLVDVLTAGARSSEGIHPQVGLVDFNGLGFIRLRHHRHRAGGGVNPALGFGLRHPLHPVGTGFKLECPIDRTTRNAGNDFLVAAMLTIIGADNLDLPALAFGITHVHLEQVTGENRRLIAPGAGTNLQEYVLAIVGILGQHQALELFVQFLALLFCQAQLLFRHGSHVGITVAGQFRGFLNIVTGFLPGLEAVNDGFNLGKFPGQVAEFILVGNSTLIAQQRADFLEAVNKLLEAGLNR